MFRRTLFVLLAALGIGLLAAAAGDTALEPAPLRRVAQDLMRVEYGEREHLSDDYPAELARLAGNLNDFIDSEREHLKRYRNTLADLAHSLKTPLAVMRSQLESSHGDSNVTPEQLRWTVVEQVGRMDEIVAYQLSRAATSGHTTFAAPISIGPCAEEVVAGLEKIYASRKILCEFEIDAGARFYGEQGDLLELLGNLLENAFKWAEGRVLFTAQPLQLRGAKRIGLEMTIEDDGPGIPDDKVDHLSAARRARRRARAGSRHRPGHRAADQQGVSRHDESQPLRDARRCALHDIVRSELTRFLRIFICRWSTVSGGSRNRARQECRSPRNPARGAHRVSPQRVRDARGPPPGPRKNSPDSCGFPA